MRRRTVLGMLGTMSVGLIGAPGSSAEADQMFEGFSQKVLDAGDVRIFVRVGGSGSSLLLLHGFPQTHLMWRDIAAGLARDFTVVCADLRGYGASGCPASAAGHLPYAKRTMAADMVNVMS